MKLHERGIKADQDRAALLISYEKMVKVFHVKHPVTAAEFSVMDNWKIMRVCKDLYNGAPIKLAKKLERILLKAENPPNPLKNRLKVAILSIYSRLWLKVFHLKLAMRKWGHA